MTGGIIGLLSGDLTNLRRDPMLVAAGLAPLLVAVVLRVGSVPTVERLVPVVDIVPWLPVILGFFLLLTPFLMGFVVGFLLLEEREDRILEVVAVTPRGHAGFMAYRLGLPAVAGGVGAVVVAVISGLSTLGVPRLLGVAILCAGSATLVTMTMAAMARDRVQGLAVVKVTGFALLGAVGFQLLPNPWKWALAPLPQTWVLEAVAGAGKTWPPLLIGTLTHAAAGWFLWRRVRRRVV
jgi:ABC-type Na+ efflux pump permease subunit